MKWAIEKFPSLETMEFLEEIPKRKGGEDCEEELDIPRKGTVIERSLARNCWK